VTLADVCDAELPVNNLSTDELPELVPLKTKTLVESIVDVLKFEASAAAIVD